jgi:hypothetical protein
MQSPNWDIVAKLPLLDSGFYKGYPFRIKFPPEEWGQEDSLFEVVTAWGAHYIATPSKVVYYNGEPTWLVYDAKSQPTCVTWFVIAGWRRLEDHEKKVQ